MKSMLIIETPRSCVTCPLSFYNNAWREHQCRGRDYYRTIDNYEWQGKQCGNDNRPEWCPLSPIPKKKDLKHYIQRGDAKSMTHMTMFILDQGYNNCIDEILKEK